MDNWMDRWKDGWMDESTLMIKKKKIAEGEETGPTSGMISSSKRRPGHHLHQTQKLYPNC